MTDEQINQKVEIGIVEATQNKKTYRVRRVGDYSIAGYVEDPLIGKRLLVRSSQDDIGTKPNLSSKLNKDIDARMSNLILNGAKVSAEPTKYIKKKLNTQQRVSDSKQINEFVEQYSQYDEWIIEKSKEIEDLLSESNFKNLLKTNYEAEIKGDNIKTKNSWIQNPLSMIIMAKDFLYQNNYFNISDNSTDSNSPEILLYDSYWNFGQSEVLFEIESSSEYNSIVKKLKCKLKKFQNKSLNYNYRSLIYYYHLNRTSFEVKNYLINFDNESLENLEKINDMSQLLLFMNQFELTTIEKLPLKTLEYGTYLLIEKIDLSEDSPSHAIPAILPLYAIEFLKKKTKKKKWVVDSDEE